MRSLEAKIVVLGSQGVGKTSVVVRYVADTFNKHVSPTIGASFFTCKMQMDNYRVKLQVWDTAGQERFRSMAPMYYRKANAAMLVFDITNPESFEDLRGWVLELKKNVDNKMALCVLGNKCDMKDEREVSRREAQDFASSIGAGYFETSAMTKEGITDVFVTCAKSLVCMIEQDSNCGLRVMDSYNPNHFDSGTFSLHRSDTDSSFTQKAADQQPQQSAEKSWCCFS